MRGCVLICDCIQFIFSHHYQNNQRGNLYASLIHKVGYTIIMIIATLAEFVYLHL